LRVCRQKLDETYGTAPKSRARRDPAGLVVADSDVRDHQPLHRAQFQRRRRRTPRAKRGGAGRRDQRPRAEKDAGGQRVRRAVMTVSAQRRRRSRRRLTGNLPNWPPSAADIHVAEQARLLTHPSRWRRGPSPSAGSVLDDISISNSIFTPWLVMLVLVVLGALAVSPSARCRPPAGLIRVGRPVPRRLHEGRGRPQVVRLTALFGTLFLFALLSNWLGRSCRSSRQSRAFPFPDRRLPHQPRLALTGIRLVTRPRHSARRHRIFHALDQLHGFRDGPRRGVMIFVGFIELFSELFRHLS